MRPSSASAPTKDEGQPPLKQELKLREEAGNHGDRKAREEPGQEVSVLHYGGRVE